jgi:replicative DNA helicase
VSLVSSAAKITSENNIGKDAKRDLESVLRDEDRKATPFAFDVLTKLTRGGYGAGDLVLFVGSPGGGKTTMIIANMVHALKLGRTVVHYTLELTEDYTLRKYYACLIDVDVETLGNADVRVDLEEALAALPGRLIVKEYSPKRESFRTIETHLQQLKDHEECIPDVMVIDYLDYIRSYTTRSEKKDELDDVYIQAKGLAKELRIPIISPSQANRTAANSAIIEGSALAGSYDKLMIADMVFSLARTTNDKNAGIGRLHVMKNRYGRDGSTYMCEIDIARNYIAVSDEPMTEEEIQNSDKIPRKQIKKVEDQLRQLFET